MRDLPSHHEPINHLGGFRMPHDRCCDDTETSYRKADCKLRVYATLFSQFPLETVVTIVDEIAEQLHADLAKREQRLQ
jgi:hypothetical protein